MGDTFSKRQGIGVCSGPLIFDDAPQTLRVGIWNLIEDSVNQNLCSMPRGLPRGMNACLAGEVIRGAGKPPLSA